jgi:nucleotide-binding universal stress UspA family protein
MHPLREILLPTDFSPPCVDVARYAAGVARHFSSKITLLHVLPALDPAFAAFGSAAMLDEVLTHQNEETCKALNSYLSDEFHGIPVKHVVSEGDPAEIIATYCASERVGLVMMPTRGCAAFRRFLMGSVTAKILQDVDCPVWTSSRITDRHTAVSPIPKIIVCAIDRGPESDLILKWAADLASGVQARLIVAHAILSLKFHLETHFPRSGIRRVLEDAHARISNVLHGRPLPEAEVRVEGGSVSKVVRSVVEDSRADLLIVGRSSNGGMMGRSRTHSYASIRESTCPVISI